MEKVSYRNLPSQLSLVLLALMLTFSVSHSTYASTTVLPVQAVDTAQGKALFKANCAACHKLYKKATGPALFEVGNKYDREWLYKWIKNSQELVKAGDATAVKIFEENNKSVMTAFPTLTNADIDNILAYTYTKKAVAPPPTGGDAATSSAEGGLSNNIILGILALLFGMLVVALLAVNKTLRSFADKQGIEIETKETRKPIWQSFVENQFLVLVTSILLLLTAGYFAYGWMSQVGVDQGYAPVQPIHYSHRIHAGDNQIDCNYCHSSARKSKTSGIPSLNVCMNCHKTISEVAVETQAEGSEYGVDYNAEIQKLYAAVGWDEGTQAYTGDTQAVEWIRIHNLPDFAYFNHSQHVTVAGVECQTCHGPVEEMEIMEQHSPLTMGWCINCHRETNVKVEDNAYYEKIHAELSKKYGKDKLTAAEMGGLECGKCHY
jgi:mono/diheme cytochrome c family protein